MGAAPSLPHPVRVAEQFWPDGTEPVVSVFCMTYNHAAFVEDALQGFLMQRTTFPVEIFVHDDASTDGTAEILKAYAASYPKLFRTVLQVENQWSKHAPHRFLRKAKLLPPAAHLSEQRGEFIAMCEGDDFWVDPMKLEKQFRFMRENPSCAGVFHRCLVVDAGKRQISDFWNGREYKARYSQKECLLDLGSAYATASLFFRKSSLQEGRSPSYYRKLPCDHTLDVFLTESGDLAFIDFVGSAYRKHPGGVWWSASSLEQQKILAERFLCFLSDPELRRRYSRGLVAALSGSYRSIWWAFYKGGPASWMRAYARVLGLIRDPAHYIWFARYSVSHGSVVRFTLGDLLKSGLRAIAKRILGLWARTSWSAQDVPGGRQ